MIHPPSYRLCEIANFKMEAGKGIYAEIDGKPYLLGNEKYLSENGAVMNDAALSALDEIRDAQAVVFGLPLYVDGVPSHVLRFLEKMEAFCKDNDLHLSVYCIANNGFIDSLARKLHPMRFKSE